MTSFNRPVRTTLAYGFLSAFLFAAVSPILTPVLGWKWTLTGMSSLMLSGYGYLLLKIDRQSIIPLFFPSALLFLMAAVDISLSAFFIIGVLILSWIRSSIRFRKNKPLRPVMEGVLGIGSLLSLYCFAPFSTLTWAASFWLFFLIQSVYFILPGPASPSVESTGDPFESARKKAEDILWL